MGGIKTVINWGAFPVALAVAVLSFYSFHSLGLSYSLASFFSSLISVLLVITFEAIIPFDKNWKPTWVEVKTDAIFTVLVQLLLPKLLMVLLVAKLLEYRLDYFPRVTGLWPHELPAWLQMALMMVIADFFRYWLHRMAHLNPLLWRFHAVHHSAEKLYWLNVGRFHPLDKLLQYFVDTMPFILLGVSQEVVSLYFAVYAVKGFFQHSNIDAKLGFLNYIFSGPELHRWHHSVVIRESNTNYGNNLIIWDLLFGTFFLPKERRVETLGLINRNYPKSFLQQMRAPFINGLDKADY